MKKKREWKYGRGMKGTIRAAILHHPDKFDPKCKDPDRLCPYAIFSAMKKKGFTPHYKDQESTVKGKPKHKKEKSTKESTDHLDSFKEWLNEL